jgi:hypothetical protein
MLSFLDKYLPLRAPDAEVGTDAGGVDTPQVPINERPADGPGSGRSNLRQQLESNFEKSRKADEDRDGGREKPRRDSETGKYQSRARAEGIVDPNDAVPEEELLDVQEGQGQEGEAATAAPEGWTKEAKAEWANLPPAVQAAVAKREADMAAGVENIKQRYQGIDQALAPRMELIRRHNKTPAEAVNQLFSWFEALSSNPVVSFPALANSFNFDLRAIPGIVPQQQAGQQQPDPQAAQQQPQVEQEPPYVTELRQQLWQLQNGFQTQVGQLSQSYQQDKWNQTGQILGQWSKDKPYFNEVRHLMGQFISSGIVPPLANGDADLDSAYDRALWAMPEVRQKVMADQQKARVEAARAKKEAEQRAQQEQADKARKAGLSLGVGAPGTPADPSQRKAGSKGKSIRDSILEARDEVLNRA